MDLSKHLTGTIKLIVFDFDGVFTNNEVIVHEDGSESVVCNRSDGLAVSMLRSAKVPMVILSSEQNQVVSKRASKLQLPVIQGVQDKVEALKGYAAQLDIDPAGILYVGNDINDLGCMEICGLSVVPADANPVVAKIADFVLKTPGGKGAVRELAHYILKHLESCHP